MIEVHRMTPRVGAVVEVIDVRRLSDAEFAVLYRAWLDANVLVVRDQHLEIGDYLAYSRRFGVLEPHPSKKTRHPDCAEITLLGVNKFNPDGTLGNKTLFCDSGSDGMTIDSEGNVYLSSGRAVQVYDKTGKHIESIPVPEVPSNMCFGGKDMKTLFITARTGFYAVKTRVKGVGPQ